MSFQRPEIFSEKDFDLALALADSKNMLNRSNAEMSMEGYDIDENNNVFKVFRCSFCPFQSRQKKNCKRHISTVHKGKQNEQEDDDDDENDLYY